MEIIFQWRKTSNKQINMSGMVTAKKGRNKI